MTHINVTSAAIPQSTLNAALRRLNAAGLEASAFQPDESPVEMMVSYTPRRRGESPMQTFTRTQHETTYWRVWAAADGTARVTCDQVGREWTYADITAAVGALAGDTLNTVRV